MNRRQVLFALAGGLGVGSALTVGASDESPPVATDGTNGTRDPVDRGFAHEVIDDDPPVKRRLTVVQTTDLTGNGRPDVIAGGNADAYPGRTYVQDAVSAGVPAVDRVESHLFWYENPGWKRHPIAFAPSLERGTLGDLDGDGDLEVVLSECDSPTYGTHPGRVAVFDPPEWEPTILSDGLFNPHTLKIADFDGDGNPDVYVAELGLGENPDPKHLLFFGDGAGGFERRELDIGVPTHCAKVTDMDGDGRPDIVGKPWAPRSKVDVWYNRL